ncbi:hypothetical protein [Streptomyces sp. NPDC001404]|uniref:hypothetical protein n=1 Tax=Streptomyces sp. NPDC001404 TaxID=3364571 RepID=UPI003686EEDE
MSATLAAPAPVVSLEKKDVDSAEVHVAPLSRGMAVFVVIVAFVGTVLATVDVFVNGWLAAAAHVGWVMAVFGLISLFLGAVLALVFGPHGDEQPVGTP